MDGPMLGERVTEPERLQRLRELVVSCADAEMRLQPGEPFPFATPSFLRRGDVQQLRTNKYWVAEKSDGERVLLLAVGDKIPDLEGCYLVSEHDFDVRALTKSQLWLPSSLQDRQGKNQHKTLLDCMVVYNHHFKRYALMILDVYMVETRRMNEVNMTERITAIREQVVKPLRNPALEKTMSVPVLGKEYHPLERISSVLSAIKETFDDHGPRYLFQSTTVTRFNENDGLIFIEDAEPLLFGRQPSMKKWKWPRLLSVRLLIRPRSDEDRRRYIAFHLNADKKREYFREIHFTPREAEMIDKALKEHGLDEGVFDCHFDVDLAEWRYNRPRFDYTEPSDAFAVMTQLEQTACSHTAKQLVEIFDERYRPSAPSTPHSPGSLPQNGQPQQRPQQRPSGNGNGTPTHKPSPSHRPSPAHVAAPQPAHSSHRAPQPSKDRRDEIESVAETPSPPTSLQQSPELPHGLTSAHGQATGGLKRAHPDGLLVEQPDGKRPRTE